MTIVGRHDLSLAERTAAAGRLFAGISVEPDHAGLEALADLVDAGHLWVHVEKAFPLEQVAEAHHLVETGSVTGKVVLTL